MDIFLRSESMILAIFFLPPLIWQFFWLSNSGVSAGVIIYHRIGVRDNGWNLDGNLPIEKVWGSLVLKRLSPRGPSMPSYHTNLAVSDRPAPKGHSNTLQRAPTTVTARWCQYIQVEVAERSFPENCHAGDNSTNQLSASDQEPDSPFRRGTTWESCLTKDLEGEEFSISTAPVLGQFVEPPLGWLEDLLDHSGDGYTHVISTNSPFPYDMLICPKHSIVAVLLH